jgi:hypothetical protein
MRPLDCFVAQAKKPKESVSRFFCLPEQFEEAEASGRGGHLRNVMERR